jgi:hypothetical protein
VLEKELQPNRKLRIGRHGQDHEHARRALPTRAGRAIPS